MILTSRLPTTTHPLMTSLSASTGSQLSSAAAGFSLAMTPASLVVLSIPKHPI